VNLPTAPAVEAYLNKQLGTKCVVNSVKAGNDDKEDPTVQVSGKFLHVNFLDSSFTVVLPPLRVWKDELG
jgi:hypothetical protein